MNLATARRELAAAGVTNAQMDTYTGFGHRTVVGDRHAPIVVKYADGALSMTGVMGAVFGTDSPQHHAGHNLGAGASAPTTSFAPRVTSADQILREELAAAQ